MIASLFLNGRMLTEIKLALRPELDRLLESDKACHGLKQKKS